MVANFDKKQKGDFFNDKLLFRTVGIALLVIMALFIVADFRIYQKKKELDAQIVNYQKQISDIKKSSQTLRDEIANSDNSDYLEKLAYEQLGEQKPGETEYIFITPPVKQKSVAQPQNYWDAKMWTGFLTGTWQWIKNKF